MPKLRTLLRWVGLAVLFLAPTLWRYGFSDAPTWVCTRDGDDTCHAEPTLYHALGFSKYWMSDYPGFESLERVSIEDLDVATTSVEDAGWISIRSSNTCWTRRPDGHSWCYGAGFSYFHLPSLNTAYQGTDASLHSALLAKRFNEFKADESQRTFVHRRPRPHHPLHWFFYVVGAALLILELRRLQTAKTRAWLAAIEAIPPSAARSPYRG